MFALSRKMQNLECKLELLAATCSLKTDHETGDIFAKGDHVQGDITIRFRIRRINRERFLIRERIVMSP